MSAGRKKKKKRITHHCSNTEIFIFIVSSLGIIFLPEYQSGCYIKIHVHIKSILYFNKNTFPKLFFIKRKRILFKIKTKSKTLLVMTNLSRCSIIQKKKMRNKGPYEMAYNNISAEFEKNQTE